MVPKGYWPCACVKRDKAKQLTAVKFHPPTAKRCRSCKCERPEAQHCQTCGEELNADLTHDCPPGFKQ